MRGCHCLHHVPDRGARACAVRRTTAAGGGRAADRDSRGPAARSRGRPNEAPLLELNDASVVLGDTRVLDRLTLSIPVGQHTAMPGPNGAGKSTFIKLLTLQQYPLAGDA